MTQSADPYKMRAPCRFCGCPNGTLKPSGGQDCVYCIGCGKHAYNAPRTETGKEKRSVTTVHEQIKPKMRIRVLERANFQCEFCGAHGVTVILHVDHLVPVKIALEDGWTDQQINHEDNLVAACEECNLGRGSVLLPLRNVISLYLRRQKEKKPDA